jgi:hypothetical protein
VSLASAVPARSRDFRSVFARFSGHHPWTPDCSLADTR